MRKGAKKLPHNSFLSFFFFLDMLLLQPNLLYSSEEVNSGGRRMASMNNNNNTENSNNQWGITINNPSRVFGEEEGTGGGKKGLAEVKVIFFDWKGTLEAVPPNRTTEFRKDRHVRPLAAMLKRGLECCGDEQQQQQQELRLLLEGVSLEKCWELYSREKERLSGTTESFSLKTLVQNLLEVLGVKDPFIQTTMYDAYFQVSNANDRVLMEGVVELLEKLKASKRYRIALIRNSKQPGDQFSKILRHHNVHHYFEALILGGELGFSKPR
jgi:FMN phosphatase YigB (HAD superfamily)